MKKGNLVKNLESQAVDAVRDLLTHVTDIEVKLVVREQTLRPDYRIDARIDFSHGGASYTLVIEVKSNGAPRFVRSAIYQLESCLAHIHQSDYKDVGRNLIPMLVSPYLSPESRAICTSHNVAYLDLVGNAHLSFKNVYIDRAIAEKPKSETRALRSMFTPKAAAILRVLLRNPDRAWRVTELAEESNVSLGHVSNVRRVLLEREWIEKQDDGVVLTQPSALLKMWRENYRQSVSRRVIGYTYFHGKQLVKRLSRALNPKPGRPRAIYSLNSAAQWLAPFGRTDTSTFYADEPGVQLLTEMLKLSPATSGANVTLHIPIDEGLFEDAIEPAPGIFCTSPIITYLDLWNGNERDREAAEHMVTEYFPWL